MSKIVALTANGDVPLPQDVREALGIAPGGEVEIELADDGAVRLRRPPNSRAKVERPRIDLEAQLAKLAYLRTGRDPDDIMRDIRGDDPFPP